MLSSALYCKVMFNKLESVVFLQVIEQQHTHDTKNLLEFRGRDCGFVLPLPDWSYKTHCGPGQTTLKVLTAAEQTVFPLLAHTKMCQFHSSFKWHRFSNQCSRIKMERGRYQSNIQNWLLWRKDLVSQSVLSSSSQFRLLWDQIHSQNQF